MKTRITLLIILLSSGLVSFSQNPWTLSDCIEYAHLNNLQVKRQELQVEMAEHNLFKTYMNILPNLNGSISGGYSYGQQFIQSEGIIIDNNISSASFGVNSYMNVFNGLQTYNNIKKGNYEVLASIQNVEKEKIELTLSIVSAYMNILLKKELMEVNRSQKEVTEMQVDRTSKLEQAGSAARGDLLEIQAQMAAEQLNVTNAMNELNLAYLNLTQLLDLDSVSGFEIVVPDTIQPDLDAYITSAVTVYEDALTFLPHIKNAEYQVNSYKYELKIQQGRRSPQLYLNGRWGTNYTSYAKDELGLSFSDQFDIYSQTYFGAGISIPVFNNWDVNNAISNAKVQLYDAQFSLDQVKQQLYKEVQQAYNNAVSAREKYKSAIEAVNSYRESFHYTEQKFNVGIVNSVEYNIAKNNFIKAESELLQAKYEYDIALKIHDYYRGIPITL